MITDVRNANGDRHLDLKELGAQFNLARGR
jgi:hypothetical protein